MPEPDIAELRRDLRWRAQLLRQHGGGRVGDAARIQPGAKRHSASGSGSGSVSGVGLWPPGTEQSVEPGAGLGDRRRVPAGRTVSEFERIGARPGRAVIHRVGDQRRVRRGIDGWRRSRPARQLRAGDGRSHRGSGGATRTMTDRMTWQRKRRRRRQLKAQPAESDRQDTSPLPVWERISMGLEHAWEQMRSAVIEKERAGPGIAEPVEKAPPARPAPPTRQRSSKSSGIERDQATVEPRPGAAVTDLAIEDLDGGRTAAARIGPVLSRAWEKVMALDRLRARASGAAVAMVGSASIIGMYIKSGRRGHARSRKRRRPTEFSGH